jgi:hypothetical protein
VQQSVSFTCTVAFAASVQASESWSVVKLGGEFGSWGCEGFTAMGVEQGLSQAQLDFYKSEGGLVVGSGSR